MLKKAKNPFYQFHDDFNTYAERCKIDDPEGHRVIFPEDDELEEEIDMMPNGNNDSLTNEIMKKPSLNIDSDDEINSDEEFKDEVNYLTKDPVRKYQFTYNKSLCMANKYPEVTSIDPTMDIEVAPGEGKRPNDIMR